ncbi:MAG: triosephosphate isomerase [marine bacterium B5-7]|nr:MAG: triosephosphate isomerase [marine bacterium B5-7]
MRQPLVAGNWKLNGSREFTRQLIEDITVGVSAGGGSRPLQAGVVVCPPYVYLGDAYAVIDGHDGIGLGAQNLSDHESGAFTGEISAEMLSDVGCRYVIVGHSERRALYGETSALVASKIKAAHSAGLVAILCVGETLEDRESGTTEKVVGEQLDAVINSLGIGSFAETIIAYEPVWAIGTGKTATPAEAQKVHEFIRGRLAADDESIALSTRILYGGSVKPDNAGELFSKADIDGGLIGGASLKAGDFLEICRAAG